MFDITLSGTQLYYNDLVGLVNESLKSTEHQVVWR
jgi:hypothetical protein